MIPYRVDGGGITLFIRLTPKGGRDGFDGVEAGVDGKVWLKARVRAVPEDGKANAALEVLVAKAFAVSKSAVNIVSGQTARNKQLEIKGPAATLIARFETLMAAAK